jgi:rhamnosyltransferase
METDTRLSSRSSTTEKIAVIYLAYHPSDDDLRYVKQLAEQLVLVAVSNSGEHDFGSRVAVKRVFENNVGVGAGYNAGIEAARSLGATHVMFHDQDSRLDPSMLSRAVDRLLKLDPRGDSVVFSLDPVDIGTGTARAPRFNRPKPEGDLLQYREVQFSGLLAPIAIFGSAKPFSEYLFVDLVDFEWCWRMSTRIRILRDPFLTIGHQLGGGTKTILGAEYSLPGTSRFYFQFRNLVALSRARYVPLQWKLFTMTKFVIRAALLPVIDRNNFAVMWKQSMLGIRAGIRDLSSMKPPFV